MIQAEGTEIAHRMGAISRHDRDTYLCYLTFFPGVLPGSLHDAEGSMGGSATPLNPRRRAFLGCVCYPSKAHTTIPVNLSGFK